MENIKIGYIGLGCRGKDLLENIVLAQKEQVVAVCDVYEDRAREGAKVVEAAGQPTPFVSTDYKDIIANEEVNTIIIVTAWESHVEDRPCCHVCRKSRSHGSRWRLLSGRLLQTGRCL